METKKARKQVMARQFGKTVQLSTCQLLVISILIRFNLFLPSALAGTEELWLTPLRRPHTKAFATGPTFRRRGGDTEQQQRQEEQHKPQHLVLIGGGHAHVQVIKALNSASRPSHLKITLIDAQKSSSYSGMVPGCIGGSYTPEETTISLESLAQWSGIEFVNNKVVDIDLDRKIIYLQDESSRPVVFDAVSVDIGSASRGLDTVKGARQYTIPTRPVNELVRRLNCASNDLVGPARLVVVGGGLAGIELSLAIISKWRRAFSDTSCTLLDSSSELLPRESLYARKRLQEVLEERGIIVEHNCKVQEVTKDSVVLSSGDMIPCTHCVWAAGAGAHPLARKLFTERGLDATSHGWIKVKPTLQSTSHPFVFAAGDCASIQNLPGGPPPKAGVYAVRAGPVLIENLTRYLDGRPLMPYQPQEDFLKLLYCGDSKALGFRFGVPFYGKWVFQMKDHIDQGFMKLFDAKLLAPPKASGSYDTSQYDASNVEMDMALVPNAAGAAALLQRTDDDVNFQDAWRVIRVMANNQSYRGEVMKHLSLALDQQLSS